MLARTITPIALLLLAGCSSGFEPGEDLAATAAPGSAVEQPDTGPTDRECPASLARTPTKARCLN